MVDFNAGAWEDGDDTRLGARAGITNFDNLVQLGNASAEASIGTDGATLGAGTTGAGLDLKMQPFDAANDNETRVHGGVSKNTGAALRLHWDDSDGDGANELGFGADLGKYSFDVKSEAAHNAIMNGGDALLRSLSDLLTPDDQGLEPG